MIPVETIHSVLADHAIGKMHYHLNEIKEDPHYLRVRNWNLVTMDSLTNGRFPQVFKFTGILSMDFRYYPFRIFRTEARNF